MSKLTVLLTLILLTCTACPKPSLEDLQVPELIVANCVYQNPFSQMEECREYLGEGWTVESAAADCEDSRGAFVPEVGCAYEDVLGRCVLNGGTENVTRSVFPGDDESDCASMKRGCELFGGGVFEPGEVCGGVDLNTGGIGSGGSVFIPPSLECREPVEGEPPGEEADGQVCTRSMISGCTEPGRNFEEYASCSTVLTQRPYWSAPPNEEEIPPVEERLADSAYMAELAWVTEQVNSCACVCCHKDSIAPSGASNWDTEAGPIWVDTMYPSGLAMAAGWVDSSALGAYPAEMNHGFSRVQAGLPTTDEARLIRFFEGELARRGYERTDFADMAPFGGPLYTQSLFEPESCENGEGVTRDGSVTWSGGGARYVYVLDTGSANPGVPPNLDLPEGVLWRLDVEHTAEPVRSGIAYGDLSEGTFQGFPKEGSAPELVPGNRYYIYVLADIGIPITRCLFSY